VLTGVWGRNLPYSASVAAPRTHPPQGLAYEEVVKAIIEAGGPTDGGTKAEAVRLHDDKVSGWPRD
jgi:hypothetical protein